MFLNKDFLLKTETAKTLYHDYMADLPIYDYHCHIDPKEIYENKKYDSITEAWLGGDHYKWRAMRSNGIEEKFITGDASDYEKFEKWCETMPYAIGNPLFHWSHLELKKYFNDERILKPENAKAIFDDANALLEGEELSVRGIIKQSNVKLICTTDDPVDSLEYHEKIKADEAFDVDVLPAFRPDKSFLIAKETFKPWFSKLQAVTDFDIQTFEDYLKALEIRIDFFHDHGCRLSDHALDQLAYVSMSNAELSVVLQKAINGDALSVEEENAFITAMMIFYGEMYEKRGWVMQLHIGTMRNMNSKMMASLGADTGFDAVADMQFADELAKLLDGILNHSNLPKTVIYNLNPKDNYVLGTLMGCFQGPEYAGKIQFGSAWWFNDHIPGMEKQLTDLASLGLLGRFIGMTTDSRSFLSYTRHDYFRRIVANLIGTWVEEDLLPHDMDMLGQMAQNIAYYNAVKYFNMGSVDRQLEK